MHLFMEMRNLYEIYLCGVLWFNNQLNEILSDAKFIIILPGNIALDNFLFL